MTPCQGQEFISPGYTLCIPPHKPPPFTPTLTILLAYLTCKQKISLLYPLSCRLSHRQTSTLEGLRIAVASSQGQGFIPWATPHAFPLINPCHSLLSYTILLACQTSKPLFFKHSFTVSIHLFRSLPNDRLPAHSPT